MQGLWGVQAPQRTVSMPVPVPVPVSVPRSVSGSDRTAVARRSVQAAPWMAALLACAMAWAGASALFASAGGVPPAVETVVLLIFVSPLVEELVFRCGVQDGLQALGASSATALWASALLFAAMHGLLRSWALGLAVLLPALAFAALYRRGRRLRWCVLAHAAANAMWLIGSHAVFSVGAGS